MSEIKDAGSRGWIELGLFIWLGRGFFGGFAFFKTCITRFGKFVFKLLNPTGCVEKFQFACVEGMAHITDINLHLFGGAARGEAVSTATFYMGFVIFWMNVAFHVRDSPPLLR